MTMTMPVTVTGSHWWGVHSHRSELGLRSFEAVVVVCHAHHAHSHSSTTAHTSTAHTSTAHALARALAILVPVH